MSERMWQQWKFQRAPSVNHGTFTVCKNIGVAQTHTHTTQHFNISKSTNTSTRRFSSRSRRWQEQEIRTPRPTQIQTHCRGLRIHHVQRRF